MNKQKGMTLIEVLIAGVILFMALSALAFVARTQSFYVKRLEVDTQNAYLKEFLPDTARYYIEYDNTFVGRLEIFDRQYPWRAELLQKKAVYSVGQFDSQDNLDSGSGFVYLYQVSLDNEAKKQLGQYRQLIWKKQ